MTDDTQDLADKFVNDMCAAARRFVELGADVVLVLLPDVPEPVALACRSPAGGVLMVHGHVGPLELCLALGIRRADYDEQLAKARGGYEGRGARMVSMRARAPGDAPWCPDVSFPPEPAPNVDLSR